MNRDIACAKTTREGSTRADASDYIVDGLPDNFNLAQQLCSDLIRGGKVKEGDMIRHSYTNHRMKQDFHIENKKNHDCSATITTRSDCLGIVVKDTRK